MSHVNLVGRMSCSAHSFLGPFGLLSSAVFSELPFVPRPPCFFHLSISTILFSGRNSHLPTCSSLSLLAVEGYVQWKVRGSGSLLGYHTAAWPLGDWLIPLQPLKAEQGAYLPGLVRRPGVLRASETQGPGSAPCLREDLTHLGFSQVSVPAGPNLGSKIKLTKGRDA